MNYIYARISTDGQNETSLEVQEEAVRNQLIGVSSAPITVMREIGSGKDTEGRPVFLNMLSKLKEDDIVAVYDNSRLSRNIEISLFLLKEISNKGARLLCDGKFLDPNNPQDYMIFNIQSSFSTYQRQIQRLKSCEGMKRQIENGDKIFPSTLFGYDLIRRGKNTTVSIIEEEAKIIRYIFDRYNQGASVSKISEELYGVPLERNKTFTADNVANILIRTIYTGYYRANGMKNAELSKEELEPLLIKSNKYPPIIDCDTFWKSYNRLHSSYKRRIYDGKRFTPHILSGLYTCPCCNKGMIHVNIPVYKGVGVREGVYSFHAHYPNCTSKKFRVYLDTWMEGVTMACFFITFLFGDEIGCFFEEQKAKLYESTEELRKALADIEKAMGEIDVKILRLVDAISEGIIDSSAAKGKMDALKAQKKSYQHQADNISSDIARTMIDIGDFVEDSAIETIEQFYSNIRNTYLKYIDYAHYYEKSLVVRFVNGKEFKIEKYKKLNNKRQNSLVTVSKDGKEQFTFTYCIDSNEIRMNTATSNDPFIDYENKELKKLEYKVNELMKGNVSILL